MQKCIIILGSDKDLEWAKKIEDGLDEYSVAHETHIASAHKTPRKVLEIIESNEKEKVVFITVAGRSNALSGFCAANSSKPVIACPPYTDKLDMLVNIHSTIQMPSDVPAMTILEPKNAAFAVKKIFALCS
jgi:5-(carboxyamino)imidazole ribonucleotide mutase